MKDKIKYYVIAQKMPENINSVLFYKQKNEINYVISKDGKITEIEPNFVDWSKLLKIGFLRKIKVEELPFL